MREESSSRRTIPARMLIAVVAIVLVLPGTIATGAPSRATGAGPGEAPHVSVAHANTPLARLGGPAAIPAGDPFPSTFHPSTTSPGLLPSVSPTIGVNYQATFNPSAQNEPGIAVNPLNPRDIIASGNDYNTVATGSGYGSWASEFTSLDGGLTWKYHPANMNSTFAGGHPCFGGDTNVFFGPDGTAYFAGLGYSDAVVSGSGYCTAGSSTDGGLFVAHSTDGGQTWTFVKVEQDISGYFVDKDWMGINPADGVISIDVMNYTLPSSTAFIDYWYSSDKGATWHGPTIINAATDQNMVAAGLAVDDQGGVDVIWEGGSGVVTNDIEFSRATAPGSSFSAELLLGTINCAPGSGFSAIGGVDRMNCFPQIIADTSTTSPYKGNLYVVYTTNTTSLQIKLLLSTNHGTTWTAQASAIQVNNDPSDGADHWFPQVTTGKNGTVYVEFLDRRYNSGNFLVDTTMAVSTNGGTSFPLNVRLSSVSGNPTVWSQFMGDYENTYWSPNGTFSVWTDFRNGAPYPTSNKNEDLYVGQLIWLNLTANLPGITATVDGSSTGLNTTEWWNHGTVHAVSVPATTTVKGYSWAFQHWRGQISSTNPGLTVLTANGTSRLEAIYTNSSLPSLAVTVTSYPAGTATSGKTVEVNATVKSGGVPVSGAVVTFSDSLGDSFTPTTFTTGANGNASSNFTAPAEITPTSDTITAAATHSGYNPASATVSITIIPSASGGPVIVAYTASPNPIVATHTTHLNVSAVGGTGTLTYAYAGLPTGCLTANVTSLPCTPTVAGSFLVKAYVNDTASHSANSSVNLSVIAYPAIASFTASPNPILVRGTTYLNVSGSGGKGGLHYVYTGLPAGCTTSNLTSLPCAPVAAGVYTITVYANDTSGDSVNASAILTVKTPAAISAFSAAPDPIPVSHTTYFNATASGGLGKLSYTFTGLPAGCTTSNVASLPCAPSGSGSFTVRVYANDSTAGDWASTTTTLTVVTLPAISSFAATPATIDQGSSTTFRVTAGSGTQPYTYAYTGLPTGCNSANTSSLSCTPGAAGTSTVVVSVTDARKYSTTASTSLTVAPKPQITSFTAAPGTVGQGQTAYLNLTATGGYGGLTYAYTGLPSGCASTNHNSLTCVPSSLGTFSIRGYANDTLGGSATSTASLVVVSIPQITTFSATPSTIEASQTVTLVVVVTGGTAPYHYAYTGLPSTCASQDAATLTCKPASPGNYTLQVTVTDAMSHMASRSTVLTVLKVTQPGSGPSTGTFAGLDTTTWLLLLGVVIVAAVAAAVLLSRRKKRGAGAPPPQPWGGPQGPPQPNAPPPGQYGQWGPPPQQYQSPPGGGPAQPGYSPSPPPPR